MLITYHDLIKTTARNINPTFYFNLANNNHYNFTWHLIHHIPSHSLLVFFLIYFGKTYFVFENSFSRSSLFLISPCNHIKHTITKNTSPSSYIIDNPRKLNKLQENSKIFKNINFIKQYKKIKRKYKKTKNKREEIQELPNGIQDSEKAEDPLNL